MGQFHLKRVLYGMLLVALCLGFSGAAAYAQQNSQITGTVTDQTGAIIPGAQLTLTNSATGIAVNTTSNGAGLYVFPALSVGTYNLKVTAKGFTTYVTTGLALNVSQTLRADVKMKVGAAATTVTVEADALQVQTAENVISTTIDSQQVEKIATENRNFAALAALGLGVSSKLPDSNTPTSVASNFTLSVNGLRQSHNIWLIDGGEADDRGGAGGMDIMPSQDAIAQFQVLSSNYPPDYGISSGATISLALKSGTNHYHGELWEFNRNTDYNANSYFNKQSGQPRTPLHYNIFGANIGGPLLPMWQHPNKTFFFWNEEWRRIIQSGGVSNNTTMDAADFPTAGQDLHYIAPSYVGTDTSKNNPPLGIDLRVPKSLKDPALLAELSSLGLSPGECFSKQEQTGLTPDGKSHCVGDQVIPYQLFNANALAYLGTGILPHPNAPGDRYIKGVSLPINVRDDIVRVDHNINDKWKLMGHYMHDTVKQGYGAPFLGWLWYSYPTVTSTLSNPSNSAALKLSGAISPDLLVEASINYDGNIIDITNKGSEIPSGFSVNRYFQTEDPNIPGITGFGYPYNTAMDTGSAPWHNAAQDYEPRVDISYIRGKHSFKFGFSYNRYTKNQQLFGDGQGAFGFNADSGDGVMDMLLGVAHSFTQYQATPIRHYVNQTPSVWAEDNWHATQNLTLQLGFRYDALPHAWERGNYVANFNPGAYLTSAKPTMASNNSMDPNGPGFFTPPGMSTPFYLNGMELAGVNGFPKGLVTNKYGTFQPRIGFADDLFGNGKTVLRGGFGTFFERMQGNDIYNAATNAPFAYHPSATDVLFSDPHMDWVTGTTASTPVYPSGLTSLALNYPPPAVAMFSLGIQHQLAPSVIWVVQYVGNLAWHQNINLPINNYPLNTPMDVRANAGDPNNNSGTNPNGHSLTYSESYRTYPGYAGITQETNNTNGNYSGFQTAVRVQNRWGLSGEVDYTWSHEIDITSYDLGTVSNPWNLKYDKGSGALDRRQMLSANYVYSLPVFAHGMGLAHRLLGGWQIAGTAIAETGTIPANQGLGLSLPYDTIGLGGGYTNRPDVVKKVHYVKKVDEWFDPSSFAAPKPAWAGGLNQGFGDARKDAVVGPGRVNFDTSLYKSFAITEAAHFEMRFESFNTFNHTEFNGVGTSYGSGNFGQITSTWDPRTLELGAKFVY